MATAARHLETRILDALARRLDGGPCFTMTSNQRIATPDGLYTYADGSVFRGTMSVGAEQTALDPVLLVDQDEPRARHWHRTAAGWQEDVHGPDGTFALAPWTADLPVEEVYGGLDRIPSGT